MNCGPLYNFTLDKATSNILSPVVDMETEKIILNIIYKAINITMVYNHTTQPNTNYILIYFEIIYND